MKYKIAVFPGDGVGPELVNEGIKLVEKAAELDKFSIEWVRYPYGAEHYDDTKELLTDKTLKEVKSSCNAVYCGAFDRVNGGNGISSSIRDYFDQYVSLRPVKLLPSVGSALAGKMPEDIDFTIIRENTEDFYVEAAGKTKNGKSMQKFDINKSAFKAKFGISIEANDEFAYQIGVLSKKGCTRIIRYAFEYAKRNNKKRVVAVDKANLLGSYNFWRDCVNKISKEYPDIEHEFNLVDAAVMNFIRQPDKYEVVVAPNMFGDILGDLGAMLQGGLSFAARANINPEGISMFEPVHGSAPKLKGKGIVNPIATIWAAALMLENIGKKQSSDLAMKAIEGVLKDEKTRTQDLDGHNTTSEMGDAIVYKFIEIHD